MENKRHCFLCGKPVLGRSDKKFCTNHCRSEYNNKKNKKTSQDEAINRINQILQHNRHILQYLLGQEEKACVSEESLIGQGFHFGFHTHVVVVKDKTKVFCYDVGYIKKNGQEMIIFGLDNI